MKHTEKKYKIDEEKVSLAGEPIYDMEVQQALSSVGSIADDAPLRDSRYNFMHDFVYANYDLKTAKELEAKNFLIDAPFEYDKIETEEDWERIEQEAEESGYATDAEVQNVMQRWLSL